MSMVEFRDLAYFLACIDTGSITGAAARVHAAQPTISHALSRLERSLGERLLDRAPHSPVRTTEAGALLAARAREALAAMARFEEDLSALRGGLKGSLRVSAVPSLSATLLPKILAALSASHPGVEVTVQTLAGEKIATAVAKGRADVGLLAGGPGIPLGKLITEVLYREHLVLVVRRDDPLSRRAAVPIAALRRRPLLLSPQGTFTSNIIHEACRKAGFEPAIRLTLAAAEALRETTRAGLGPTILPEGYVLAGDPDLRAVRLTHPVPQRQVLVVRRAEGGGSRSAEVFIRVAREHVRQAGKRGGAEGV